MVDFKQPETSGVYGAGAAQWPALEAAARRAGVNAIRVDASGAADIDALLVDLGRSLRFPDWYGANFDALHDCLTDPGCLPPDGHLLFLTGLEILELETPEDFLILLDVLGSAAEIRRQAGHPLWVAVDAAAAGLPALTG